MDIIFSKNRSAIFLAAIFVFVVIFSFAGLTSWPNVWFDEGIDIEIANNFLLSGKLDISTAPNVFSGFPYVVGTNGYPLTIPLAGVFSVFGFGLAQERIFMLLWLVIALASVYCVAKSIFGENKSLISVALIAVFAPFYGNGLTAFGEVPGFVFLIWGLFFLIRAEKQNYRLAGLLFALAAVAKPSSYLLLFPSFLIFLFLEEKKGFFGKLFKFITGAVSPLALWILIAFPNPFSSGTWRRALMFYRYPFGENFSITENLIKNIYSIFTHSTLIYFLLITIAVIFWYFKKGRKDFLERKWSVFFFIFSVFIFMYFLKSPGWLRYIFSFEILAFIFLPQAMEMIGQKIFKREKLQKLFFASSVFFLLAVQLFQLFYFRSDFYSPYPAITASFINENLAKNEEYKVGFLNLPEIAGLIHPLKKFHIVGGAAKPVFGENPLSFSKNSLPQFVVSEGENAYTENYKNVIEENYFLLKKIGNYDVYEIK